MNHNAHDCTQASQDIIRASVCWDGRGRPAFLKHYAETRLARRPRLKAAPRNT
jgi:hypothetical protein